MPLLKESGPLRRDTLYWHYPHYHRTTPAGALRHGDWKLIEYFEDGRLELYNLRDDLGEQKDLAAAMPEKARELQKMLADWRTNVGAQMPTLNPDYKEDPEAGGRPGKSRQTGGARP
jgi:arylsulfatase A-like enzyme